MYSARFALISIACLLPLGAWSGEERLEDLFARELVRLDSDDVDTRVDAEQALLKCGPAILPLIRHYLTQTHSLEAQSRISAVGDTFVGAALAGKLPQPAGSIDASDVERALQDLSTKLDIPIQIKAALKSKHPRLSLTRPTTIAGMFSALSNAYGLNFGLRGTHIVAMRMEEGTPFKARYNLVFNGIPAQFLCDELSAILKCESLRCMLRPTDAQIEVEGTLRAHLRVLEIVDSLRSPVAIGTAISGAQHEEAAGDPKRFFLQTYDCNGINVKNGSLGLPTAPDLVELLHDRLFPYAFASSESYISEFCGRIVVVQRGTVHRCIEAVLTSIARHRADAVIEFAPAPILLRSAELDCAIAMAVGRFTSNSTLKSLLFDLSRTPLISFDCAANLLRASYRPQPHTTVKLYAIADLTHAPELACGNPPHEITEAELTDRLKADCPDQWDFAQSRSIEGWSQDWLEVEQTAEIHARISKALLRLRITRIVRAIRARLPALAPVLESFWPSGLEK